MIGAILLGLLAGYLARLFSPRPKPKGILITLLLGLAGSVVGFLIFTELLGIGDNDTFDLGGLPGAVIGAILLLYLHRKLVVEPVARRQRMR